MKRLVRDAEKLGITMAELIRRVLDKYIDADLKEKSQ